jgi:hypothetical protein
MEKKRLSEAAKKRLRAGRMLQKGERCAQVALAVGVARQTVYTWKALLDEVGIDALRAVPGRGHPQSRLGRSEKGARPQGRASMHSLRVPIYTKGACALPWAYPRSRGGTSSASGTTGTSGGLSPLARGNHTGLVEQVIKRGPIPARAGEPRWW